MNVTKKMTVTYNHPSSHDKTFHGVRESLLEEDGSFHVNLTTGVTLPFRPGSVSKIVIEIEENTNA